MRKGKKISRIDWKDRVVIDTEIHHGDPCIKGTRIPVSVIVGSIADGMSVSEVLEAYPQLTPEDIRAALAYAAEVLRHELIVPMAG
ncbi:MAG: DUF433 domain-containing protein [Nitrospirae bacterium]|nr:DUF433 domain-containing protein [Nitrospirota bacterium]